MRLILCSFCGATCTGCPPCHALILRDIKIKQMRSLFIFMYALTLDLSKYELLCLHKINAPNEQSSEKPITKYLIAIMSPFFKMQFTLFYPTHFNISTISTSFVYRQQNGEGPGSQSVTSRPRHTPPLNGGTAIVTVPPDFFSTCFISVNKTRMASSSLTWSRYV